MNDCSTTRRRLPADLGGRTRTLRQVPLLCACAVAVAALPSFASAKDYAQFGEAWSRNMVSDEKGLPSAFDPKTGQNLQWSVPLGTETHSTPVVAGGRVYIGTNNGQPRDAKHEGDRGVLMCFDESDGRFLWQLVCPKREDDPFLDWPNSGVSSPVTVEGERVYLVSNRGEVLCLDARGLANGNDGPSTDEGVHMALRGAPPMTPGPLDADVIWRFDLTAGAGIYSHDAAHSSILIRGRYLYLNTGTGVDNTHKKIRTPDAPSLVVIDKVTGAFVARDNEHIAPRIFHSTWSGPSMATVNGRELIFFNGGDGIVYAFEPVAEAEKQDTVLSLKKLWQFDPDPTAPKENVHRYNSNRRESPSNFYGMPVVVDGRVFIAGGGDIFWGKNEAWLKCVDVRGGQPRELWSYALDKHVLSTPAVRDGLAYVADCGRKLHCVEAATGRGVWVQEVTGEVWSSPLVADGKVYLGTRSGEFVVMAAEREKKVLATLNLGAPISATATAANGALYVATMNRLYKLKEGASP